MPVCLDRFSHDAGGVAVEYLRHKNEESYLCEWCTNQIISGDRLCPECKREMEIRSLDLARFLEMIQDEAGYCYQDIKYQDGRLEFRWSFDCEYTARMVAKLLRQKGAKYFLHKESVTFWIRADGEMELE